MTNKKLLSAEDILGAKDIITVDVEVPEWSGTVRLQSLSGDEIVQFIEENTGDKKDSSTRILVMSAVDKAGKRLFTSDQIADLRKKSFRAVMRLQEKALEINGMTEAAEHTLKAG